jgi:BirA family biotin operon repressor/biotin-[acetyl-CoA-carboxylase] ligase
MSWNSEVLEKSLAGKFLGRPLYYYPEIGSTNDEAFRLGVWGAPEGTAVIADSQTKGKGRLQRVWHSPPGSNIYTSIILRPDCKPDQAPQISIAAGVAVAEIVSEYCPGQVQLKWPNDVLLNDKKVCGILAQIKTSANGIDFVVLGIGINVNIGYNQLPPDIRTIATSLAIEAGREIARQDVIISLYENLAKWYKQLLQRGFGAIKEKWLNLAPMISQQVQVMFNDEVVSGKALGLGDDGSLIILTLNNETVKVSAGDATILKER